MRRITHAAVLTGAITAAVALTACGGSNSHASATASTAGGSATADARSVASVTVDGTKIPISGPLKLGVFIAQGGNAYANALLASFRKTIDAIPGASVTTFDGKSDPTTQLNQLEDAIQSGRFNAISIGAVDPQLECKTLSEQAARAGILVASELLPDCGRASNSGAALRSPGTLTFVGGPYLYGFFKDYLEYIVSSKTPDRSKPSYSAVRH
jgi:ribose transport system substrate-binding protein